MPPNNYQIFQNFDRYQYQYQYTRNTLQLNNGPRIGGNDSIGDPSFGDVAFLSGVGQTDWSWGPMITDFDNDGYRDIVITNGYPRDVTDHDFITFRQMAYSVASTQQVLDQIPIVKIPNYAFRNTNGVQFEDVTQSWGLGVPRFQTDVPMPIWITTAPWIWLLTISMTKHSSIKTPPVKVQLTVVTTYIYNFMAAPKT
ncbi:hypothetical protein ACFJIV_20610 [Mucilaginibacter sp. UC70_90]